MFVVGLNRILGCLTGFWVVWVVFGWFGWIRILELTIRSPSRLHPSFSLGCQGAISAITVTTFLTFVLLVLRGI